jgi:signal transduction histidine kinase
VVDVLAIVSHEVEAARLAGGEIVLHHLGSGPFLVQGDPVGLARAFSNIIGNALRYGDAATVWVQQEAETIDITVDDNGPGIPVTERQAVFRAFYRAETSRNRSTGGTGLGLAIVLGIVERQHSGSIEIADAPSGGARLRIRLPGAIGPALR